MMKFLTKIILSAAITMLILGAACCALSLMLGADITRIADVVFLEYDIGATYLNLVDLLDNLKAFVGM